MHRRLSVVVIALFALMVLSPVAASPLADPQCFPTVPGITNCIDGRFASFWNGNGGLPVFGYPITSQRDEVNADLQKPFSTQWFERNRFEQHPENPRPTMCSWADWELNCSRRRVATGTTSRITAIRLVVPVSTSMTPTAMCVDRS